MNAEDIKPPEEKKEESKISNEQKNEEKKEEKEKPKELTQLDIFNKILLIIKNFLKEHTVYEAIPGNMKILIFNSELNFLETIYAMVKEDIYCALVYDSLYKNFIGIITIRDIMELIKFINDRIKKYNGIIVNTNFFIKEIFSKNEVQLNSLSSIKENEEIKPVKKKSFGSFDRINELDEEEGSDSSFEGEIKEKPQSSSLKQGVDFFKSLNLISINDFYRTVRGIPIHRLITKAKLLSVSLDNNLFDCAKLIKEKKTHRIIIEETKEKQSEIHQSNNNLLNIKNTNYIKNYTGFITYETMFDFFIQNYYGDMKEFKCLLNDIIDVTSIANKLTYKFDKNEKVFVVFEQCFLTKLSIMPIYDSSNNNEIFGYLFLKDLVYFFMKVGIFFSLDDSVENFLIKLYEGIDEEKPLGKERIKYINIKKEKYTMKQIFELLNASPEKKIIVNTGDDLSLITLSNIFRCVFNLKE